MTEEGIVASQVQGLRGRVLGIVVAWVVGGIVYVRDRLLETVLTATTTLREVTIEGGRAIADASGTVAAVPLEVIGLLEDVLATAIAAAGPAAPIVVVFVSVALGVAAAIVLPWVVRALLVVIPWA